VLRQYFPKGTDLARHDRREVRAVADALNNRPRKMLGWRTPVEVLADQPHSRSRHGVATTGVDYRQSFQNRHTALGSRLSAYVGDCSSIIVRMATICNRRQPVGRDAKDPAMGGFCGKGESDASVEEFRTRFGCCP